MTQPLLKDNYERSFPYLRFSITDVCNFRCGYCLPNGYRSTKKSFLNLMEIKRVLTAFAELGVTKVRLTGGEPTIRKDFLDIVNIIASIPGIQTRALTTNGYRLNENIEKYYQAGINAINISIDSFSPQTFYKITQHNRLEEILLGIERAQQLGINSIKINTVLLKGINDNELAHFLARVKHEPITIRLLELMRTNCNEDYFKRHHLNSQNIQAKLLAMGWQQKIKAIDAGPAIEYEHPSYCGQIGIIAPYGKDFCNSCNRLRVSAEGNLHLCLFGDASYPLRPLLQNDSQLSELKQTISQKLPLKRKSHFLQQGDYGIIPYLASIGG